MFQGGSLPFKQAVTFTINEVYPIYCLLSLYTFLVYSTQMQKKVDYPSPAMQNCVFEQDQLSDKAALLLELPHC